MSLATLALPSAGRRKLEPAAFPLAARHESFLDWLERRGVEVFYDRVLFVTAHPDDEVLGAGGLLPRLRNAAFLRITDGAPRNLRDAHAYGFSDGSSYAAAREAELAAALARAGQGESWNGSLGVPDQEASFHLAEITEQLVNLLRQLQPRVLLTHPYEGGHPDHDATAFAVHAACRFLPASACPELVEMASYHAALGWFAPGEFVPVDGDRIVTFHLSLPEQARKREQLACFRTQQATLQQFPVQWERFRPARVYDFSVPPHPGPLWYEHFDWGMTGPRWRELARAAQIRLRRRVGPA